MYLLLLFGVLFGRRFFRIIKFFVIFGTDLFNLPMTRKEIYDNFCLSAQYCCDRQEAAAQAVLLTEELYGVGRRELILSPETEVVPFDYARFEQICGQLSEGCPVQYILGHTTFSGLDFRLSAAVLVPRPETEELVGLIVERNKLLSPRILDVGTGSGAIAVSLKSKIAEGSVMAVDISAEALAVATQNAALNSVEVDFVEADIFGWQPPQCSLDLIVSNPPYVLERQRGEMQRNVTDYEPRLALFVPDHDPLCYYRRIADVAQWSLVGGGELWFEINPLFAAEMVDLLDQKGFVDITVIDDFDCRKRFVQCKKR